MKPYEYPPSSIAYLSVISFAKSIIDRAEDASIKHEEERLNQKVPLCTKKKKTCEFTTTAAR